MVDKLRCLAIEALDRMLAYMAIYSLPLLSTSCLEYAFRIYMPCGFSYL
jgi:hypothetical protein